MDERFDLLEHLHFNAQFLLEFALERLLEGFAGFEFAARKFPQPAQVRLRVALGNEEFALVEYQSGGNIDGFGVHAV